MTTHPVLPHVWPESYLDSHWELGSVLSDPYETGYPVSGDDLGRWRKALLEAVSEAGQ